jgi:hypothetical protein
MALGLVEDCPPASRCPYLQVEARGPACQRAAGGPDMRLMAASLASLQLWCLDGPRRWEACIFWQEAEAGGAA